MADGQKIPFNQAVNRNAQRNADDRNALNGRQLPCSVTAVDATVGGAIVEAQAEVSSGLTIPKIKIPHVGGEWIRYPVQIGEKGFFISADASLNETSGLGAGKADLTQPANLTPLAFLPVGNINWTPTPNPNYLVMYGKTGLRLQSTVNAETYIELTATKIIIHGNVEFTGTIKSNGKIMDDTHIHNLVQSGTSNSGQVV